MQHQLSTGEGHAMRAVRTRAEGRDNASAVLQEQSEVDESQAGQHQASTSEGHAMRAVGTRAEWQGPSDEDPVSPVSSCGSALDPQLYRSAFSLADACAHP